MDMKTIRNRPIVNPIIIHWTLWIIGADTICIVANLIFTGYGAKIDKQELRR